MPEEKIINKIIYSHTAIRGIAAVVVLFTHINVFLRVDSAYFHLVDWGANAVDIFFVLSGFILNYVYLSAGSPVPWAAYFTARIARIVPLYYLTTISLLPFFCYKHSGAGDFLSILFKNLFLVSGITDGTSKTINFPAWSIGVEVFCYMLIFPLLVWLHAAFHQRRMYQPIMLILLAVCSVMLVSIYDFEGLSLRLVGADLSFLGRGIFGFIVGFSCCSLFRLNYNNHVLRSLANGAIIVAVIAFLLSRLGYLGLGIVYPAILIIFFSAYDIGFVAHALKTRALQWLGERSYSIYLWHIPLMTYLGLLGLKQWALPTCLVYPAIIALVLLAADLSYRFFETPSRTLIRKWTK